MFGYVASNYSFSLACLVDGGLPPEPTDRPHEEPQIRIAGAWIPHIARFRRPTIMLCTTCGTSTMACRERTWDTVQIRGLCGHSFETKKA